MTYADRPSPEARPRASVPDLPGTLPAASSAAQEAHRAR